MFNYIKVKDNTWLNINSITSIEYYPDGNGIFNIYDGYYLIIYTSGTNEVYSYDDKEEAMKIVERLNQHGVFLS